MHIQEYKGLHQVDTLIKAQYDLMNPRITEGFAWYPGDFKKGSAQKINKRVQNEWTLLFVDPLSYCSVTNKTFTRHFVNFIRLSAGRKHTHTYLKALEQKTRLVKSNQDHWKRFAKR